MASEAVIDIDALLQPIEGDDPAGVDPREDAAASDSYYDLKDARAQARTAERRAFETLDDVAEASSVLAAVAGDWRSVSEGAQRMLASQTKDVEVASWLIEALTRNHGFAGLRDGFRVVAGLVGAFRDGLHPRPDPGEGIEETFSAIAGLNGVDADGPLLQPIRMIRLSDESAPDAALWHERMAETGSETFPKGAVDAALGASSRPGLVRRATELAEAQAALKEMDAALTELCGIDAPPLSRIAEDLEAIETILRRNGGVPAGEAAEPAPADDAAPAADADAAAPATGGAGPAVPGQIQSREQAFEALGRVSDYFRQAEPHSPISYTLDEIVRRGRMPLTDLLVEVLPDEAARHDVLRRLGIDPDRLGS